MRVGVLTGGGDCPGLNAVIRAVVRRGVTEYGFDFVGFRDGWKGPLEGLTTELGIDQVRGILPRGGTILGSSRTNPFKVDGGVEQIKANLAAQGVDVDSGADVVALVRAGDLRASLAVREAGRRIGAVLTTCVSLLNPSVIAIGGIMAGAGEHLLAGIREVVYQRSLDRKSVV